MIRKLLAWIFNRWTLLLLLVLALVVGVWQVGPQVSVGEWHPLDTARACWIATAVILLTVAALLGWRWWQARRGNAKVIEQLAAAPPGGEAVESADMQAVRQRFEGALGSLRQRRFGAAAGGSWWRRLMARLDGQTLYELPWYLIIGAPGAGKTTALRNAGLRFPLAEDLGDQAVRGVGGTRQCDWWFADQAVLIDTAGRFTTQDSDQANDRATWNGFLALLKRSRPRQPLNGVLVVVSATDLLARGEAERQRHAQLVRARVQELHEQLGVRLPLYVLVTKCDLLAGFGDYFAGIDKALRAAPWGFTFGMQPQAFTQALGPEFDALLARLDEGLIDRLQAEPDPQRRARIYGFPAQFASLKAPVAEWVQRVFAPSPFEADPMLRGVYFVSGTQEGTPIDRVLGAVARRYRMEQAVLPPQRASGRSYFLERLLGEVVFAEQGLAGTRRAWERRRGVLAGAGYAALAVLAVLALGAWFVSWRSNGAYIDAVAARVEEVRRLVQQTPNRPDPDLRPLLQALDATRGLAEAGGNPQSPPLSLGFGLYQGRKLDGAARTAYERMLRDAVLPRLALGFERQLKTGEHPESQYEALKSYLMTYDMQHFDAEALRQQVEADWDAGLGREQAPAERAALSRHLAALLALGPAVSPLEQDKALVELVRRQLAAVPLPERVYNRIRQRGLGDEFPEFTVAKAAEPNAALVFERTNGQPLTRGVSGLYTYRGYYDGFQKVVGDATAQLAGEKTWVLGLPPGASGLPSEDRLVNDVRRLYLLDYRDRWKDLIASIRLRPITSTDAAIERVRFLSAPDNPLVPLMKAISRETTLLAGQDVIGTARLAAENQARALRDKVLGKFGAKPATLGAPGERMESIVDDEFASLRRVVTAPDGGKPPIQATVDQLAQLQVVLITAKQAAAGGAAPPPSPLPTQMKADAAGMPEPVRSLLNTLGDASAHATSAQLRETLAREVRSQVGEFCVQAARGRYPLDPSSSRDVTPADFAQLFGPGGRFDAMQQKLAAYIDTSTRPWSFRPVDGTPLGRDVGSLPQFQNAQAIREAFFAGGNVPGTQLTFKPVEMDPQIRQFQLDVDGMIVKYEHGPQLLQTVRWPGPRGSNLVRASVEPMSGSALTAEGPWALLRLFDRVDRVSIQPGSAPEKFRAVFDFDGRKVSFDVTAASVRHPFRMKELHGFSCPNGL